ncbi:hypothetical protein [Streptomyces sp. NPDC004008]
MRQRNTTGSAWTFMGDPPVRVEVGETTDHEVLLDGWTAVDDEPEQEPATDAPAKTTRKRAAAADTDEMGGESR